MAPEHEAHPRAFYDHESEEPRRGRRPAADWGVGEDIFDRMPSRFSRAGRRAEHRDEIEIHRSDGAPGDSRGADGDAARGVQRDGWRDGVRGSRASSRLVGSWADDE